jgi:hypothetical protein
MHVLSGEVGEEVDVQRVGVRERILVGDLAEQGEAVELFQVVRFLPVTGLGTRTNPQPGADAYNETQSRMRALTMAASVL